MAEILIVDDKPNILKVMGAVLAREGYQVDTALDAAAALARVCRKQPDLIISDVQMPGSSGVEFFHALIARESTSPSSSSPPMRRCRRRSARSGRGPWTTSPSRVDYGELKKAIRRVLAPGGVPADGAFGGTLPRGVRAGHEDPVRPDRRGGAVGLLRFHPGRERHRQGAGGRSIHRGSRFREGPFVPVNCAAFNPNLLESELFGYEAGAFTGANRRKIGFLETAAGGTLFLDEISETSADLQVKLLRVLQEKAFVRVGGTELVRASFRLVAATNRDIDALAAEGKFRQDLYYRLNVVPLFVPPLRERAKTSPSW
jgi:DNA-binding NtrC family response regulator